MKKRETQTKTSNVRFPTVFQVMKIVECVIKEYEDKLAEARLEGGTSISHWGIFPVVI